MQELSSLMSLGSLDSSIIPNQCLATGSKSFIGTDFFEWRNIFQDVVKERENVVVGNHVTCPSVIDETKEVVQGFQKLGVFIDPEIGYMAKACIELEKEFSYLHIVSDNVVKSSIENLSNERDLDIREKRKKLFLEVGEIIKKVYLNS